jgi:hypothetical protein
VVGEPQVVVGQVADDLPSGLLKRAVAKDLTVPRAFRVVEEAHSFVGATQLDGDLAGLFRRSVADQVDLEIGDRLRKR